MCSDLTKVTEPHTARMYSTPRRAYAAFSPNASTACVQSSGLLLLLHVRCVVQYVCARARGEIDLEWHDEGGVEQRQEGQTDHYCMF